MDFREHLSKYLDQSFIDDLLSSLEQERTNSLVLNTNKISIENFQKMFPKVRQNTIIKNAFYYDKNDYEFGKSFYFDNGLFYIMDTASMLVSFLLPIEPDDLVLDMCAAPGGKSIFLSIKNPEINLVSNDINYQRALLLSTNVEKLGLGNVIVCSSTISSLENYYKTTFDKIILDAPCSGSSMFRKSSDMKNDWTYNKVIKCQVEQHALLEQAAAMLKDGGIISYSTCSFSYEEDEEIILSFLKNHPNFHAIMLPQNNDFYRTKELPEAIHLFPNKFKGEGQFICQLKKDGIDTKKESKNSSSKNKYGFNYCERINDRLYAFNCSLSFKGINVLRKGLHILTYKGQIEIPSFQYAHYQNSLNSIVLSENEAKLYLHGDQINKNLNLKTGFYPVSYQNINLGYVHYVDGKLKNLYPKGLRH